MTDTCAVAARDQGRHTHAIHLTCSSDQDDVVLSVSPPTSLAWINRRMAVEYHVCGRS